jgi:hypothetical protein
MSGSLTRCCNPSFGLVTNVRARQRKNGPITSENNKEPQIHWESEKEAFLRLLDEVPFWELGDPKCPKSLELKCKKYTLPKWRIFHIIEIFLNCKYQKWVYIFHLSYEIWIMGKRKVGSQMVKNQLAI